MPWGEPLDVRRYPAGHSQKQSPYPNGTALALTGRCTVSLDLHAIAHLPKCKQASLARQKWCEVWHAMAAT